ncbi:hypothetical protein JNW88_14145 [Micromonospora sp. ATA32]|nr:hypothetical protein [Micromonospora sp. ATA32]
MSPHSAPAPATPTVHVGTAASGRRGAKLRRAVIAGVLTAGLATVGSGAHAAAAADLSAAETPLTLTATVNGQNALLRPDFQGFSVESADFAHGYLTTERMRDRLRTLGPQGVIRLGGYSMDLVWPAFGEWSDTPARRRPSAGPSTRKT